MKIWKQLLVGMLAIVALIVLVSFVSVRLSEHIGQLRYVELPMEQNLREVEVSIWETVHAASAFRATVDSYYADLYAKQVGDVEEYFLKYRALTDAPPENAFVTEFDLLWDKAKIAGLRLIDLVVAENELRDDFVACVEEIEDLIDSKIHPNAPSSDPKTLSKATALRELAVSMWKTLHLLERHAGIIQNPVDMRSTGADFEERLRLQFRDVDRFLEIYKALATSKTDFEFTREFEKLWQNGVSGKEVIALHNQSTQQFLALYEYIDKADDVIDFKMQEYIQTRVEHRDQSAATAKFVTITTSLLAIVSALVIGIAIASSISVPTRKLMRAAEELGQGNLKYRINSSRSDELGDLSRAFDRMADEVARSNNDLRQFAFVAAHDLQEPLRKVASCCQVLDEDYSSELDDEAKEWLGFAVDAATHMRTLIQDLLEYSRAAPHDQPLTQVDSAVIAQNAVANLQELIEENGAEIEIQPLPRIVADELQLELLLQNLIGNAVKYRSDAEPKIEVGAQPHGNSWRFYVRDNGIGIDPEHHDRIFAIFKRLHGKQEYAGTGVGLAICRKIVERWNGQIWVESTPGKGSTFFFTCPQYKDPVDELCTELAFVN